MNEKTDTIFEVREMENANAVMSSSEIMNCLAAMHGDTVEAYKLYGEANLAQFDADYTRFFGKMAIFVGILFYIVPGAVLIYINNERKKKQKELYNRAYMLRKRADEMTSSIKSPIPVKYRFPAAIEYAYELCQTGRANSLPELYNRLDEQIHRWNVENQNSELIRNQQETNVKLGRVESNAKAAAVNSAISAIASIASNMY